MRALAAYDGFSFGADPEFFLQKNGVLVPASDYLPGNKAEPHALDKGAVQVDGMAAEFNIEPAKSYDEFTTNIVTVIKQIKGMLPKDVTFSPLISARFDEDVWARAPEEDKELGCSPDTNAWTGDFNEMPGLEDDPRLRCVGGHVHIGWTEDALISDMQHVMNCRDLVKQLDWMLGSWSLAHDNDNVRRKLYGKAGACRYKPYGVEYRVLSNFWVTDARLRLQVWNRMQIAINTMRSMFMPEKVKNGAYKWKMEGDANDILVQSINTSQMNENLKKTYSFPITTLAGSGQF